jgi:HEAT repeat protein
MMRQLIYSSILLMISAAPALAQSPRPASEAQTLSQGWAALAAGRASDAVAAANGLLKRRPGSHAALSLKIEALASGAQPGGALDVYEEWLPRAARNVEDRGLLEAVAGGFLRSLARTSDPSIRSRALLALAATGDEAAVRALKERSTAGDQTATQALATTGDAGAVQSLQAVVKAGTGRDLSGAVEALAGHGALTPDIVEALRTDRVPMNRAAAARALAAVGTPTARQQLDELARDSDPLVRTSVTLARAKNGDPSALADARTLLASEVPDLRLMAAEALIGVLPRDAVDAVRPLLANGDANYRFRAAALVGQTDPAAVAAVTAEGLSNENPLIRQEAAHLVAAALPDNLAQLRQLLRNPDPEIVLAAAASITAPPRSVSP